MWLVNPFPFSGMSNSGFRQDGVVSSDQRLGRRGRRQKSSTKLTEGKSQALYPSGKENTGAGTLEGRSHDNTQEDGKFFSGNPFV